MKKKEKAFQRSSNERGITLVALVITIIILIILAVVAINAVFGDSGLLKYAQDAKNYQANADTSDAEMINDATSYIDGIIGGGSGDTDDSFEPVPTPEPETGGTEYSMTNGVIEIKWLSGKSNNVSSTPNAPKVKSISNGTMELVKYDEGSQSWVAGSEYSYEKQTGSTENGGSSKWANARVTIDEIESYFVWIPRYAYRIIYFDNEENKTEYINGTITEEQALAEGKILGYSDSRGIVDAEGKKVDGVASTTKTMVSRDYFMTHPAFTSDVTIGGWNDGSDGLEGIWVGKYETSLVDTTTKQYVSTGSSSTGNILLSTASNRAIAVQPNMSSWRNITIGNSYTNAKGYSTELKSHMLKNSEWGAVTYLTESAYGRNGTEVTINNNSSYITGIAGDTISASSSSLTTNTYNTEKGVLASSTGNVYGIYDLSGGAWERTAGYYNGEDAGSYIEYGSSFASIGGISDSYSTVYNSTGKGSSSYNQYYIYGDATAETAGWHSDYSYFAYSSGPFFGRSGVSDDGSVAGVFSFDNGKGSDRSYFSFRLALSVL